MDLAKLKKGSLTWPENTHRWGKYYLTVGHQFYKFGFAASLQTMKQHILFVGLFHSGEAQDSDPFPTASVV